MTTDNIAPDGAGTANIIAALLMDGTQEGQKEARRLLRAYLELLWALVSHEEIYTMIQRSPDLRRKAAAIRG